MKFKQRTVDQIADMICGNFKLETSFFPYRSSSLITRFFRDADTDYQHDGSTRGAWVAGVLNEMLTEPSPAPNVLPDSFARTIATLMDLTDGTNDDGERSNALALLNATIAREGFEAFYGPDNRCYLRHSSSSTVSQPSPNPHRPFSKAEIERRAALAAYLDKASEDELIEHVLLPLFRQLGFQRITAAGHKDKALEYGKDVWMKYPLPTGHILYFGIQAKRGKLDAAGVSKAQTANVAEIHNQATMMLGHEVFDPDISKRVLVDHAYIVAGGEITKQARNWIGNKLDASKRSQIMFMDREDILNLFAVSGLAVPASDETDPFGDDIPF